jgi:twitching motility two-component system response regulator PilH
VSGLVLLVDDDPAQRRLLERVCAAAGWRVVTAADGDAGLEAARQHQPTAIVLDVMMPRLNGYQTCRLLRGNPGTARTPIIIATAKDQPADEFWAREVGADAFLAKPLDPRELLAMLDRLTETA